MTVARRTVLGVGLVALLPQKRRPKPPAPTPAPTGLAPSTTLAPSAALAPRS